MSKEEIPKILQLTYKTLGHPVIANIVYYLYAKESVPLNELKQFINTLEKPIYEKLYSPDLYITMLTIGNPMVARVLQEGGDHYEITEWGKDFIQSNLSLFKENQKG